MANKELAILLAKRNFVNSNEVSFIYPGLRYENGAETIRTACGNEIVNAYIYDPKDPNWQEKYNAIEQEQNACRAKYNVCRCSTNYVVECGYEVSGISITQAKKLLREFGGTAWTNHYERNGELFETTPIPLDKNNSNHKYNRHL